MWGSGKQAERATDQEGHSALTGTREGCSHRIPKANRPADVLREDPEDRPTELQAACAATPKGSNTDNSKLHCWDYKDACYDSEIDEHKGGGISRQLICQLNCLQVPKGKQMKTHTMTFLLSSFL